MKSKHALNCLSDGSWLRPDPTLLCKNCTAKKLASCAVIKPSISTKFQTLAIRQTFAKNDVIFAEQEPADKIYVITSGMVRRVKHMQNGQRFVSAFLSQATCLVEYHQFMILQLSA